MEIIAGCLLGFIAGAVVSITAMCFARINQPKAVSTERPPEPEGEPRRLQEQWEKLLSYNGSERDDGGV